MASNNHKSKLVEEQINKLMVAQSREFEKSNKFSPMVIKLEREKHVHKLKEIFEEKELNSSVKEENNEEK